MEMHEPIIGGRVGEIKLLCFYDNKNILSSF